MARRYTVRISGTSGERFYADASRDAVAHGWAHGRNGGGLLGGAAGQPRPLGREKIPLHAGNDFKSRNGGMSQ